MTDLVDNAVFDADRPMDDLNVNRPPVIEQDMKEMERRRRVKMIIESQIFKEELERIIETQLNEGYSSSTLSALQQVTELLLPGGSSTQMTGKLGGFITPINDIRGIDAYRYDKKERQLRCKLAAVNRLIEINSWSSASNSITLRISQEEEHFLTNPFGLNANEISASCLLKVDMQGNVIDPGSTNFSFNRPAFCLHSVIHSARPDIKAIIYLQHAPCVAVSSMKSGLLILSAESALLGDISYHDYRAIMDDFEKDQIVNCLGAFNKVLVLRNHGILTCGGTIEEALFLMQNTVAACEVQLKLSSLGANNLHEMSSEAIQQTRSVLKSSCSQVQSRLEHIESKTNAPDSSKRDSIRSTKWKIWDLEFESKMRMLDNAGYRTGYNYRQPLLRAGHPKLKLEDDIEIPPASQSHLEDNWIVPLRKLVDGRKTQDRLCWVNTPNNYQRIEIEETGTNDPKKITKWVTENSPTHKEPIKIDKSHQFVPINVDPSEFRKKQKELKFNRLQNKISEGPQSKILDGGGWEEGVEPTFGQTTERIVIGAASKGIIQREYQHNARVYKSAYEKNPFDNVTEQELQEYRSVIERKERGESDSNVPEHVQQLLQEPINQPSSPPTAARDSLRSPLSDEVSTTRVRVQTPLQHARPARSSPSSKQQQQQQHRPPPQSRSTTTPVGRVERSQSAKMAAQGEPDDDKLDISTASKSSKDISSKNTSEKEAKKEKKKKGLRTPSFLKKKSKKEK